MEFNLKLSPNGEWAVDWPMTPHVKFFIPSKELLSILFRDLNCHCVGFRYMVGQDRIITNWFDQILMFLKDGEFNIIKQLNVYTITGVAFHHRNEAEKFKTILEKMFLLYTLKTLHV